MQSSRDLLLSKQVAHKRRLHRLEVRRAAEGLDTPPAVLTEIEDITAELAGIAASITALDTVEKLIADSGSDALERRNLETRLHVMVATVQATVAEFSNLRKHVTDEFARVYRILKWIGAGMLVLEFIRFVMQVVGT